MDSATSNIRVVHVEDDADFGDVTATYLEREGDIRVVSERRAETALDRLGRAQVDCVVCDYHIPDMDSLDFLDSVREVDPDLPFVLFTGESDVETMERALDRGVTDYVLKGRGPASFAVLAGRIRASVAHARAVAEARRWRDVVGPILDQSAVPVAVFDRTGRILESNDRADELLGNAPGVESGPLGESPFGAAGPTPGVEYEFSRPDGETITISVCATAAGTDDAGGYVVGVLSDGDGGVTGSGTPSEALDAFAGVVSHDLGNVLTVAQTRLQLARETGDDEQFEKLENSLARADALVVELADAMRAGRLVNDRTAVDLADVFETAWESQETRSAELVVENPVQLLADREALCRLAENLVRNAVEHGGEGVTVRVGGLPDGFYVADDGPGIPEDERESVFDAGHTTKADGGGFGLVSVQQIARAHGWTVRVDEGPTGGARFEFTYVAILDGDGG